jgi:hypothetical protein
MPKVKQICSIRSDEAPDGGDGGFPDPERPDGEPADFIPALRATCPVCEQPVGVPQPAVVLPGHAVCATPWNPFGPTVCPGSGRPVPDAAAGGRALEAVAAGEELARSLPDGLDWRMQPFSHAGGPAGRPVRVPAMRRPAVRRAPRAA